MKSATRQTSPLFGPGALLSVVAVARSVTCSMCFPAIAPSISNRTNACHGSSVVESLLSTTSCVLPLTPRQYGGSVMVGLAHSATEAAKTCRVAPFGASIGSESGVVAVSLGAASAASARRSRTHRTRRGTPGRRDSYRAPGRTVIRTARSGHSSPPPRGSRSRLAPPESIAASPSPRPRSSCRSCSGRESAACAPACRRPWTARCRCRAGCRCR